MKLYNNNFVGNLTEIIKDNNLKSQFTNIISLKNKIGFKRTKHNEQNIQITKKIDKNEIIRDSNNSNLTNDNNNILFNLNDNYENFNINKMGTLHSFVSKFEIEKLLILKDGRILTNQKYYDENGNDLYKLCVYSIKNTFICDINIEFRKIEGFYLMDDGNVIIDADGSEQFQTGIWLNPKAIANSYQIIKIMKINQNNIEEIFDFGDKGKSIKKISNDIFLVDIREKLDKPKFNEFFQINIYYTWKKMIYKYDNNQLVLLKNIDEFYESQKSIRNILQINEKEYALYKTEKSKAHGENDIIMFYDIETDKVIEKLKVGKGENCDGMILLNKDNLIVSGDGTMILIDIKNRKIINEFKFDYYLYFDELTLLSEKIFISYKYNKERKVTILFQYELENLKTIKLKEKRELEGRNLNDGLIAKYKGNKIVIYSTNLISIFG